MHQSHNSILVTDYLTKMSIKTVPQPPYSRDLAPCDFWLFPKLRDCRYETIEEMKEACDEGHWHAHTRRLASGLPEVVGTVQQVHCSQRRLLRRGLEFHVCTINKSAHMKKKSGNLFNDPRIYIYIYIYIYILFFFFFFFVFTRYYHFWSLQKLLNKNSNCLEDYKGVL